MDPKPLSFPISRRSLLFTAGSIALTIPLLSACGSGDTDAKGSRSKKGTIAKDGVLTIGAAVSTSNVFPTTSTCSAVVIPLLATPCSGRPCSASPPRTA